MIARWAPRLVAAAMAFACLTSEAPAETRALTIRDAVSMSSFGLASVDPSGRWTVYERRGPYDSAPAYDLIFRSVWLVSELWIAPVDGKAPPERLLPAGEGPGLLLGDWSPGGDRLLIYRLRDGRLEAGVVTLADRSVWWTGLSPDWAMTGSVAAWLDDRRLGLTVYPGGELAYLLRQPGSVQRVMPGRWATQKAGQAPSRTVIDTVGGVATSEAPEPSRSLVRLDVETQEIVTLAQGRIRDWAASPDARTIAVLKAGPGIPVQPDRVVQIAPLERGRLELIDVASGRRRDLDHMFDVAGQLLRWTAASDALLIWVREDGQTWNEGDLARVTPDGRVTRIPRGDLAALRPGGDIDHLSGVKADWMGETPILYARAGDGARFDWYALAEGGSRILTAELQAVPSRLSAVTDKGVLMFADGCLGESVEGPVRLLPPDHLALSYALRPNRMVPVRLRINTTPRRSWALAMDGAGRVSRIDRAGEVTPIGPAGAPGETTVLSSSSGAAVAIERDHGVETLHVAQGGRVRDLDRVNAGFADLALSRPVPIRHLNAAGTPVVSWLFLPPNAGTEIRGVVVLAYPGAIDDGRFVSPESLLYGPRAAMIAAEGFAVLSPEITVSAQGSGAIAGFEADIDRAVDAVALTYPSLPMDRLALLGHSFGGYTTLGIAERSSRYRSYIAWAAPSDMFGAWGEFVPQTRAVPEDGSTLRERMGWVESNQGGISGPPWAATEAYVEASPFLKADRIKAPLLLIGSDMDFVSLSQAERMFSAINRSGGKARLVTYWGEWHENTSPANILDVYDQITGWLDETLGEPPVTAEAEGEPPSAEPRPRSPQPP
ncbi:S9 family peptidase [soil metagenome]